MALLHQPTEARLALSGVALGGHVLERRNVPRGAAVLVEHQRRAPTHPHDLPRPEQHTMLELGPAHPLEVVTRLLDQHSSVVGVRGTKPAVRADRVLALDAGDVEPAIVDVRGARVRVGEEDAHGRRLGEPSKELGAGPGHLGRHHGPGDVASVHDDPPHGGIPDEVREHHVEVPPPTVPVASPHPNDLGAARVRGVEPGPGPGVVVGVDELQPVEAVELVGAIAQHGLHRRAHPEQAAVVVSDGRDVGAVAEQRLEHARVDPRRRVVGDRSGPGTRAGLGGHTRGRRRRSARA